MRNTSQNELMIIDQMPSMVFQSDVESRFIYANHAAKKLWGFSHKDIAGYAYDDIKCEAAEMAEHFRREDLLAMERCQPIKSIAFVKYTNGDEHIVVGEKSPFYVNGQVAGIIGNYNDVTHLKSFRSLMLIFLQDKQIVSGKSKSQFTYVIENNFDNFSLTERQMEVLFYLVRGKTAKEIGRCLFLSRRTVESHIMRIKDALDCHTKAELVEKVISLGLVQYIPHRLVCAKRIS